MGKINSEIRDKLFLVIRAGMDIESSPLVLSPEDYEQLIQVGERQSLWPIIFRGLKKTGTSEEVLRAFEREMGRDLYQFSQHDYVLGKISTVLDEAQIPYVPLKGAVLRNFYPIPGLRTSCDIDVLVRETDLERAIEAIETKTSLKMKQRNYHDVSMYDTHVCLELHFSIRENMENIDKLLERAWEFANPAGNGSRNIFTLEFQVFYIIAHMCHHMVDGGLGIRPFIDLWLLRTKTNYDEKTVRRMCSECDILKFYQTCCDLADVWMQDKKHTETTAMLESLCLSGGVFGSAENAAISKLRGKSMIGYYFSRLFADRAVLESLYPELKKKPYLLPICQIRRWTRLINRQRWREIRGEVRNARETSSESINSFDELLKSLELSGS